MIVSIVDPSLQYYKCPEETASSTIPCGARIVDVTESEGAIRFFCPEGHVIEFESAKFVDQSPLPLKFGVYADLVSVSPPLASDTHTASTAPDVARQPTASRSVRVFINHGALESMLGCSMKEFIGRSDDEQLQCRQRLLGVPYMIEVGNSYSSPGRNLFVHTASRAARGFENLHAGQQPATGGY